jgi:hypothetical protein
MKQKWQPMQFVEISMHEIFAFQDRLDTVKDNPEEVWEIVDDFFMEAENQLELSPGFIRELKECDLEKDFTSLSISEFDDLWDDDDFDANLRTASDYVNYVNTLANVIPRTDKEKYDIPFVPRHNF